MKKYEIQVIVFMIMLTRCLERIFNPMRYTGIVFYLYVCEMNERTMELLISNKHFTFIGESKHIGIYFQLITLLT